MSEAEKTFTVMLTRSVRESATAVVQASDIEAAERVALSIAGQIDGWEEDGVVAETHVTWSDATPGAGSASTMGLKAFHAGSEAVLAFMEEECDSRHGGAGVLFDGRRLVIAPAPRDMFASISAVDGWYAVHKGTDLLQLANSDPDLELVCQTGDLERAFEMARSAIGLAPTSAPKI